MSRPWMPLYVADYLKDTGHLSAAEHGAYLLLIMHYWSNGGIPADDRKLARIARMTDREWKASRATISEFFDDDWKHGRIDAELAEAADKSESARTSAKKRWDNKRNANASANAMRTHLPSVCSSPSQSPSQDKLSAAQPTTPAPEPVAAAPPDRFAAVEHACRNALGSAAPADPVIGPMLAVIDELGQDRVLMILGAEARRPRTKPIRTWRIWAEIVRENAGDYRKTPTISDAPTVATVKIGDVLRPEKWVREALEAFRERGRYSGWNESLFGAPPDHCCCRVPDALLAEYGFERPPFPDDEDAA